MGRPRRPFNGVETIGWSHDPWLFSQHVGTPLGVREQKEMKASTHHKYRAKNGVYDPLTYLLIVDVIANIDPNIELRAKNLVNFLDAYRDQFHWDSITVGKVLADICESYEDVLGKKQGMLEGGMDYKGQFYRIHHNPDTARVWRALHKDLERLAKVEMTLRARGERTTDLTSPLRDCPSVRIPWRDDDVALVG